MAYNAGDSFRFMVYKDRDYFQDITPPSEDDARGSAKDYSADGSPASVSGEDVLPEKTIRHIQIKPSYPRSRPVQIDQRETPADQPPTRWSRLSLWGGALLSILILAALAIAMFRPTTVTIIPRTHAVLFDDTARFFAYPKATPGTLPFTVEKSTLEDSQSIEMKGIERVEEKASCAIAVTNNYSSAPVKLLKNTRFQTAEGLIYRSPTEVLVPGKRGSTAGRVEITVVADLPGEHYNISARDNVPLPGLKGSPMYSRVRGSFSQGCSGGFAGDRPGAAPGARTQTSSHFSTWRRFHLRAFRPRLRTTKSESWSARASSSRSFPRTRLQISSQRA